jgi:hypothetical protein
MFRAEISSYNRVVVVHKEDQELKDLTKPKEKGQARPEGAAEKFLTCMLENGHSTFTQEEIRNLDAGDERHHLYLLLDTICKNAKAGCYKKEGNVVRIHNIHGLVFASCPFDSDVAQALFNKLVGPQKTPRTRDRFYQCISSGLVTSSHLVDKSKELAALLPNIPTDLTVVKKSTSSSDSSS